MGMINKFKSMSKTEKIVISSIAAAIVIAGIASVAIIANNKYLATTMRLLRVEGTVNIEDSTGSTKPVLDNIRFQSGDALSTGSDGLASVGLDDTKIVTLENDSRVEFTKHDKQLELNLTQGALFFEVTEKLADDEKYEIKTSNMTVGIRGTSGYVYYSESGLQSLIITDGVVKVTGYNPKTNETKVVEVHGGEKVTAYLYDESTDERDSIEFEVVDVPEEELPEFPLQMLAENPDLMDKVCKETGWDKDELLALVDALTDPEEPTPTPDEIIEITDYPTPTQKPKTLVTITPTPTTTLTAAASPSPKPSATPTATVSPTPGPSTTPDATTTPTATPTDTVTPTPTATPTVATYTVSFDSNGVGKAPASQTVEEGDSASEPAAPSADGYTFEGWYANSACTAKYDFASAVTKDITLYAKWTLNAYTVSFNANGHGTAPFSQSVSYGDTVSVPARLTADGYSFEGWYVDANCTDKYDFDSKVTSDIVLYAGWTINTYTVTFDSNGHGPAPSAQYVDYGDYAIFPDPLSDEGYIFDGWYTNDDCTEEYDFNSQVTSDIVLYAGWTIETYTVDFDANGHGTAPAAQYIDYGYSATKPANLSETGYTFGGWYTDSGCTDSYDFDAPVKSDITLYAKWTINTYTVTFNANGHGTAPAAQTVNYGSKATKPSNPNATGYTFGGWYTNAACTSAYSFDSAVTGNVTLYAKWTINTYTVTFNANGHGTAPSAQTVNYGSKATEPSQPTATGYIFGGWYTNAACTSAYSFNSAVTGNVTLYAKWTPVKYTVTFNANGHGTAPSAQNVDYGSTATKPTDPTATDYTFGGWYTDSACTNSYSFSTTITGNITLYAKWTFSPTYPAGYSTNNKLVWNKTYNGHEVLIIYKSYTEPAMKAYYNGQWYDTDQTTGDDLMVYYYIEVNGTTILYYTPG